MGSLVLYFEGAILIWLALTILWLLSVGLKNASIVDVFWGSGFVLLNGYWFLQNEGHSTLQLLHLIMVSLWGLRLSLYIGWRNHGKPEDYRYQKFRQHYGAERYWWFSYFQVFLLQGLLLCVIAMPLFAIQGSKPIHAIGFLEILSIVIWGIGFFFESVGDWQMARFKANPSNKGKVMDRGLWKFTRHPNYFGDAAVWWAFGILALAQGNYWAPIGSLVMTGLLIKVSGVALLEKNLKATKPQYAEYIRKTSSFIPWFPKK